MSIRSLADFNRSSLGGDGDWLTPPPSPPRPQTPGRHDERGMGTFNWPPARTSTWPYTGTFSWPRTAECSLEASRVWLQAGPCVDVACSGVDPSLPCGAGCRDSQESCGFAEGSAGGHLDQPERRGAPYEHVVHAGDRREMAVVPVLGKEGRNVLGSPARRPP